VTEEVKSLESGLDCLDLALCGDAPDGLEGHRSNRLRKERGVSVTFGEFVGIYEICAAETLCPNK